VTVVAKARVARAYALLSCLVFDIAQLNNVYAPTSISASLALKLADRARFGAIAMDKTLTDRYATTLRWGKCGFSVGYLLRNILRLFKSPRCIDVSGVPEVLKQLLIGPKQTAQVTTQSKTARFAGQRNCHILFS
jgi:hypothetical protein